MHRSSTTNRFPRLACLFSCLVFVLIPSLLRADIPLGSIGGKLDPQPGTNFLKVVQVTSGAPGDTAGLQVGDCIYKAFGEEFRALSASSSDGWKGSVQDLGEAIERAESGDGTLPLTVLRPGVGNVELNVQLPAVGAFGPAYPLGSPKFDAMYQWSCEQIHSQVMASSDGGFGYNTGFFGLILLSHPNWNDTTGANPYRNSINKLRDWCVDYMNRIEESPVEGTNLDGTPNDGSANDSNPNDQSHVPALGLENWSITTTAMFLAEYRRKTADTAVDATLQRAANAICNRVQDYQQPPYEGNPGPTKIGLMGHGGVGGDYAHLGYSGMNIMNAHAVCALAMLKNAGATVNATKFANCWQRMKECTTQDGGPDDGNVGYYATGGGYDASGRTAGAICGMEQYGGMSAADSALVDKQKAYIVRQWQRMQHAHAYTVGGVVFYQFALPYLTDREQRFIMENTRYFYQFHRSPGSTLEYFGGRENNAGDGYLNFGRAAMMNTAMAQAIHSGNLPSFPQVNNARIHADFKAPRLKWPSIDARTAVIQANSASFDVDITDYLGTVLNGSDYTASWTHVSGPATATFSDASSASTTVNFPMGGSYRIQLQVTRGGYTLTEPIDLEVLPHAAPAGYTVGTAEYRVYKGIPGSAVVDLTGHAKYPDSPDITDVVTKLEGTHTGDSFGSRIRGYIIPQVSGNYTFYISSDDSSEFKFGTSEAAATKICGVTGDTNRYEWTKQAGQTSAVQALTAGTPYFFEVNHKENGGGDHVAVAWTGPSITTPTVISGHYLAQQGSGSAAITFHPVNQTAVAGGEASFNVQVSGQGPFLYEWTLDGVSYWPASTSSALDLKNLSAGAAGTYQCKVTTPNGTITSNTATLTVTGVGALTQGGLWREVYEGIGGGYVSDLTNSNKFPRFPNSGGVIPSTEAPSNFGGNFGERWTGWIKPDITGNYVFHIASDDASEIWLSTDEQPLNKVKIATLNGYTTEKNWSSGAHSAPISLTAGNRYYIEVRHKEGGGGDHCAVTWQKPGDPLPTNGTGSIPSQNLEYFTGGVHTDTVNIALSIVQPRAEAVRIRPSVGLALEAAVTPALDSGTTITWTKQSGPGTVTFENPNSLAASATFSAEGDYVLRCTRDNGNVPIHKEISVKVSSVPEVAWTSASIAEPTAGNAVISSDGTVTVQGSGNDIFYESDECHFFYQDVTGDFDVRARVVSKSIALASGTHAQIHARETTDANSRHVFVSHDEDDSAVFQYRNVAGQFPNFTPTHNVSLPTRIRLVRSGGDPATGTAGQTFTGYYSTDDGLTWIQNGTYTYTTPMPDTLHLGFAVSSHGDSLNTVVFDNISGLALPANYGPVVDAGPDGSVAGTGGISLNGIFSDDAFPNPPHVVTTTWSKHSGPGNVTFGDTSATWTSASFSQPGTYVLRLSADDGEVTTYDDVTITVVNGGDISVTATDASASEVGPDTGTFTITRSGDTTSALTVNFTMSGSAVNGTDYATLGTSVVIPAGSSSATVTLTPINDGAAELPETAVLTIAAGPYTAVGSPATVTITSSNTAPVAADSVFSTSEASGVGTYVGTVGVTDADSGDVFSFAITAGNTGGAFAINANGMITVASVLDFETLPTYVLTVEVTDLLGASDTATVTINLGDAYDAPVSTADTLAISANGGSETADVLGNDTVDSSATKSILGLLTTPVSYEAGTSGNPPQPTSQGWSEHESEDGNVSTGNVTGIASANHNGSGLDAWVVTDNTNNGGQWLQYRKAPTAAETTKGNTNGWMLETKLRFINDFGQGISTQIEYGNGSRRFLVFFDLDGNGNLTARTWGTGGATYTITSGGTGNDHFHDVVILYNPANQTASFSVDGVRYGAGSWIGDANGANGVEWGNESSGGQGSAAFHHIKWSYFDTSVTTPGGGIATVDDNKISFNPNGAYASLANGQTSQETIRYALTDGTGLVDTTDLTVTIHGENDSDADTLNDDWEVVHYGAIGNVSDTDDTDGDGFTAFAEMVFGMNPNVKDSPSAPVQSHIINDGGTDKMEVKFRRPQNWATLNVTYRLQTGNDLVNANWAIDTTTPTVTADGDNEWLTFVLPLPTGTETRRFYRCIVTPN